MCFVTLSGVAAAASLAGSAISAVGAISGGNQQGQAFAAQQQMANYQAQIAQNNAIIAERQAEREIQVGSEKAARTARAGAAQEAAIKAGQAASGVDVNTGSAANVQVSQRELDKLDTETVLSDAQQKAYGYRSQAQNFRSQSGLYDFQGRQFGAAAGYAPTAGYLKAGGTLLSAASSLPLKWGGGGGGNETLGGVAEGSPGGI